MAEFQESGLYAKNELSTELVMTKTNAYSRGVGKLASCTAVLAIALSGCTVHPLPDDLSPVPTEAIVAAARCELREGLVEMVKVWYQDAKPKIDPDVVNPNRIGEKKYLQLLATKYGADIKSDWNLYMDIAIAYDWTFDITETNHGEASAGFSMPFLTSTGVTAGASSLLTTKRQAKRTFKNQDTIGNLLTQGWHEFCTDEVRSVGTYKNRDARRDPNLIYPTTGSIGLRRAAVSFLRVAVQEGGVETFTDEMTFTTTVSGSLEAGVVLNPVPNSFRLTSATGAASGGRVDLHRLQISFAFPKAAPVPAKDVANKLARRLANPQSRRMNPAWRAAYALCVIEGRAREAELKIARLEAPEVSCLKSTDAFYLRGSERGEVDQTSALGSGPIKYLADCVIG